MPESSLTRDIEAYHYLIKFSADGFRKKTNGTAPDCDSIWCEERSTQSQVVYDDLFDAIMKN